MYVLSGESLKEISNKIFWEQKPQTDTISFNYFLHPNISIMLYNPKVVKTDKNYLVFEFDKYRNIAFFNLLKAFNSSVRESLKSNFELTEGTVIYDLYYERSTVFTIRCSLPKVRGKFMIDSVDNDTGAPCVFRLPRPNAVYSCIRIDVRNLWERDNKIAYNLEVKEVKL
jgi:hypothetical protein